jgi:peptide/nickel transport system permease protein
MEIRGSSIQHHDDTLSILLAKGARYGIALFIILSLNFLLPRLMPGDPIINILGEQAFYGSSDVLDKLRADLQLDQPMHIQYFRYLGSIFTGEWGYSYLYLQPVVHAMALHLQWTLVLVLPSVIFGAVISCIVGALAAWYRNSHLDIILSSLSMFLYSMPHYWLAMLILLLFSFQLGWFPLGKVSSGDTAALPYLLDVGWHMALPLATLTIFKTSYDFLIVRNAVISIYGEDYILMAQAKGLSQMAVLFKHALRNALAPLVTVTAIQFGTILSGALLVEIVFSWPGMGTLIYDAIGARDYPLLQAAFFIIALCMLLANFIADVLYTQLDPKLRA